METDGDRVIGLRKRRPSKVGRPPLDRAGEVDARLLDAARELFLSRGFDGTTCDQVAALAQAGKASLYARYANKEALLAAVVHHEVERSMVAADSVALTLPLRERLSSVGRSIIEHSLQPQPVALMRLIIAEAGRFPELAAHADAIGRQRGVRRVAEVIACTRFPDAGSQKALRLAEAFVDLVFVPHQMRALLGEDLKTLRAHAGSQIASKIALLEATGLMVGWG